MLLAYGNLTLIGSGHVVVAGWMDNDGHFLEMLFEIGAVASSSQKHMNQDSKWYEVQMIQHTSAHAVGQTDKSTFQQVDLPGVFQVTLQCIVSQVSRSINWQT